MTETVSETDDQLIQLEGLKAFQKHASQMVEESSRYLSLLSHELDFALYNQTAFCDTVSRFVRSDRRCEVRILVKEIRPLLERGHRLLTLGRRLSSKITIRQLQTEPQDSLCAYLIGDRRYMLYQHEDGLYSGFANYNAAAEARNFLEEFTYLWEHHGYQHPSLRTLVI